MRVVMPHTRLRPKVCQPLAGHDVTFADVSGDDEAYWRLFDGLWREGQTFTIIEHDVVVRPDTLDELEACEHDFCSFLIPYVDTTYAGLGCVKFSAELIARVPDALAQVAEIDEGEAHPPKHWCRLDSWLQGVLERADEVKHVHKPPLEHLRDYEGRITPAHGCWQ